ncbi:MAG: error-prone DNA polymerase [Gammaproteobacteria bacterium]|nr:error-prone DNA polymerase [Gammaproteobacteria bacterium]
MSYAELHCVSNFTFLRGASHPGELVKRARELGYSALALTDECSLAGVVRAHVAAREAGLPLVVGSELWLADGPALVVLAENRAGYGALARLITQGRRAAPKGQYRLTRADLDAGLPDCLALWLPAAEPATGEGEWLRERFAGRLWVAVELTASGADRERLERLTVLARELGLPAVAAGDVHMHQRRRRALQDLVTAVRLGIPVARAGAALFPNGERCLRPVTRLEALYPRALLDATREVAERCRFSLDELRYEYPEEIVPVGTTPEAQLRRLVAAGAVRRWPGGVPAGVQALIERELALVAELGYERYFLTVHDLVEFARGRGILCQGRGSAANSAACYALGITEVDPARMSMLFERFISRDRNEPPDIDVDFEHERREEVIQYLYAKYGRGRAALTATVICYRPKSAVRDVGKALGLDTAQVERLAQAMQWWDGHESEDSRIEEAGFDTRSPLITRVLALTRELVGFPRHLSQHTGGFVISRGPLEELVPVENAAMPERTVIQWDKDDLDELGLLKVDVLGLGMLTAIRRALALVSARRGREFRLPDVPAEDPAVYEMICRADTIGVFQIESRAQMAMLPRLRPKCYYDLVIEVAIVRPGPIQGQMVHPYLRRRNGEEAVDYPGPEVEQVLARTLGVPIFQEQVMQLAIAAAGFTPGEADALRRAMAAWKRRGGLEPFEAKLKNGLCANGYGEEFADRIFRQILGFGDYGFPEAHAASFALLVYVSAWLKHHEPAAFCCALLNSQPMGFYAPAQLLRDAREHGVAVLPVDVNLSAAESTLLPADDGVALRLGLDRVRGLAREAAERIVTARTGEVFRRVAELARRAGLGRRDLAALAAAGALAGLAGNRHRAGWAVLGVESALPLLPGEEREEGVPLLPVPGEGEDIVADYRTLGFTLGRHPLALVRPVLERDGWVTAAEVAQLPDGAPVRTGGIVVTRQRPGSAGGVIFVTLEDETGYVNLVVWSRIADAHRRAMLGARLLGVRGRLQREGEVRHVVVDALEDRSALLGSLTTKARSFR